MPNVNGKNFPYTKQGMAAAKKAQMMEMKAKAKKSPKGKMPMKKGK